MCLVSIYKHLIYDKNCLALNMKVFKNLCNKKNYKKIDFSALIIKMINITYEKTETIL